MKLLIAFLLVFSARGQILQGVVTGTWGAASGGTAATPTFSPVAGSYSSTQSVTISTATTGCGSYIYWNLTGSPTTGDTHGTSVSVASSETVYAKVIGCPGYTDSAVGSAAYMIGASPLAVSDATGTDDNAVDGTTLSATAHKPNLAVGDTVYVFSKVSNQCGVPITWTFTDDASTPNTYTQQGGYVDAGGFVCYAEFVAKVTTAKTGATLTMTANTSGHLKAFSAIVVNHANTSSPVDQAPTITSAGSVSSITSGAFTTTAATEIILVGGGSYTYGAAWTVDSSHCNGGAYTKPANVEGSNAITSAQYCIVSAIQTGATAVTTVNNTPAELGQGVVTLK